MEEILERIEGQNKIIIGLLTKMAFKENEIYDVVTRKKKTKENYVKAYNALDGTKSAKEIAKIAKVDPSTISRIINEWLLKGIIYEFGIGYKGKPLYKNLMMISKKKE